jgi:hypothetical protein
LDDVFVGYLGEGFSLSDHYKTRYTKLNAESGALHACRVGSDAA